MMTLMVSSSISGPLQAKTSEMVSCAMSCGEEEGEVEGWGDQMAAVNE